MADFLSLVLWAYCTWKHTLTQATCFSLFYKFEIVVHIKVVVPLARLALASKLNFPHDWIYNIEILKKEDIMRKYMVVLSISKAYIKDVRPRILNVGDLVERQHDTSRKDKVPLSLPLMGNTLHYHRSLWQ